MGQEMYFVERGNVEVVDETRTTVFATLERGAFFGETALFFKSERSATIQAINICSIYILDKQDFESELMCHDYDMVAMVGVFTTLMNRNKLRNEAIATNLKDAKNPSKKLYRMIDIRESATNMMENIRSKFKPLSTIRAVWNLLGLLGLIYYSIQIPYDIAFVYGESLVYSRVNFVFFFRF